MEPVNNLKVKVENLNIEEKKHLSDILWKLRYAEKDSNKAFSELQDWNMYGALGGILIFLVLSATLFDNHSLRNELQDSFGDFGIGGFIIIGIFLVSRWYYKKRKYDQYSSESIRYKMDNIFKKINAYYYTSSYLGNNEGYLCDCDTKEELEYSELVEMLKEASEETSK